MIAKEIAKHIIEQNTGKEPNDDQITRAEILIVEFARAYANALEPTQSTGCDMPDVSEWGAVKDAKLNEGEYYWFCNANEKLPSIVAYRNGLEHRYEFWKPYIMPKPPIL